MGSLPDDARYAVVRETTEMERTGKVLKRSIWRSCYCYLVLLLSGRCRNSGKTQALICWKGKIRKKVAQKCSWIQDRYIPEMLPHRVTEFPAPFSPLTFGKCDDWRGPLCLIGLTGRMCRTAVVCMCMQLQPPKFEWSHPVQHLS